jgi:hypothetical protein
MGIMAVEAYTTPDANAIFPHFTKELSTWAQQLAQETDSKVHKIVLKFILEAAQIVEEHDNPQVLLLGPNPIWTKLESARHEITLLFRNNQLIVDPTKSGWNAVKPKLSGCRFVRIEATAFVKPGPLAFDINDKRIEKTLEYRVKA